ncbi:heavy metal translocating P-type ATPase [Bifidobacterium samirii]|uniref:ATPase n=1 Tax=Bifidobacterium samirii TaxID=2306974 RepID=A0A430FG15_9BIFI|nr:heavy metal translocating P-type ATPase [Bifidobacterium samirii]RSX51668.1 ATPase [Bifidobacterium samirii]
MRKAIDLCKHICTLVPLLPVVILASVPLALLGSWRPWYAAVGDLHLPVLGDPGVGQWLVIALVAYIVVDTVKGMVEDIRNGQVGVDLLAVVAILSTVAVHEYWASWAVTLMITSGEAIEAYAEAKAESSLTALMQAAPQTAHVVTLPGLDGHVHDSAAAHAAAAGEGGFRRVADAGSTGSAGSAAGPAASSPTASAADGDASAAVASVASGDVAAHYRTVPADQVDLGDVIVVLPGETVPVDGELLSGSATLDLSAINGEPMPREVFAGARVMSGAVNGATTLTMRATQKASDSQYQRIVQLVASAQESRPAVVRTADRLAVPFTILSLLIAGVAWMVAGTPLRFAQVLVLATPCPLLIAAPVAYIAGTGRLAKSGILIKTQDVLENLGRVTHVFFDKTGTLTVKQPQVVRVEMLPGSGTRLNEDHVLMMAGVVEGYSVHILSKGIEKAGREAMARLNGRFADGQRRCPERDFPGHGRDYPVVRDVREDAGKGVSGEVNGHLVRVGRLSFANANAAGFQPVSAGAASASVASTSPLSDHDVRTRFGMLAADEMASYVSVDGHLVARIVMRDVPRANARESLARLHELGVGTLTMLTGDKRASARVIADEVGIDEVHAELFPEDKVAAVRAATAGAAGAGAAAAGRAAGRRGRRPVTMMVGDGVNDAPVLAVADLGVAMTDGTSTAASESAQVVIMNDDIAAVPQAIAIARRTRRVMLEAVLLGLGLAVIGMVAAAFDLIPVVVGAFLQEAIDVVSILWALTALFDRD